MSSAPTIRTMDDPTQGDWNWEPQPGARELVERLLLTFIEKCPEAARFGERLLTHTGTHITDWVGVILTPDTPETRAALEAAGYAPRPTEFIDADIQYAFWNPAASTPDILLTESPRMSVGLLIDSVADFFAANQLSGVDHIQGEPHARARWAQVAQGDGAALWVFERHGYDGFHLKFEIAEHRIAAAHHAERFRARARRADQAGVLDELTRAVCAAADELGADWAADLFMCAEREYFLRTHPGAKAQYLRQHAMGLGMANIDHIVYACSQEALPGTIELFAKLGFERRETFAVTDEDWATVLEQPVTGHVIAIVSPPGDAPGMSGTVVALLGEGLLSAGPSGLALRGEIETIADHIGVPPGATGVRAEVCAETTPFQQPDEAGMPLGGEIGPVLTMISRVDGGKGLALETLAWEAPSV